MTSGRDLKNFEIKINLEFSKCCWVKRVREWADQMGGSGGGGGGDVEDSPCIKIGYSEPTRNQNREGSSTLANSSRVSFGVVILDFDWLTRFYGFRSQFWLATDNFLVLDKIWLCLIMYWDRQCIRIGYKVSLNIKIGSRVYWLNFGTVSFSSKKSFWNKFLKFIFITTRT